MAAHQPAAGGKALLRSRRAAAFQQMVGGYGRVAQRQVGGGSAVIPHRTLGQHQLAGGDIKL